MVKISVVGCGQVGMACAIAIVNKNLCHDLVLMDMFKDKAMGEAADLHQGLAATSFNVNCVGGSEPALTAGSDIIVITAGARQRKGESRLSLLSRNVGIFKSMIPGIAKHSPDAIMVVVSNPCDILAKVTRDVSGFPMHRVFGSGTLLDTSRLRRKLGDKLALHPSSIHAYILGEHGDSSMVAMAHSAVGGIAMRDVQGLSSKELDNIHTDVVESAGAIIQQKGYTSWGIGFCISQICDMILSDSHKIAPVSTSVKGFLGISDDIWCSVPCLITRKGIIRRPDLEKMLDALETTQFLKSVDVLRSKMPKDCDLSDPELLTAEQAA